MRERRGVVGGCSVLSLRVSISSLFYLLLHIFTGFFLPSFPFYRKNLPMSKPSRETEKILGNKKMRPKTKALLEKAIRTEQLPVIVPRGVGADFVPCCVRTLVRAERRGELTAIRRGQSIGYERGEFLRWAGVAE